MQDIIRQIVNGDNKKILYSHQLRNMYTKDFIKDIKECCGEDLKSEAIFGKLFEDVIIELYPYKLSKPNGRYFIHDFDYFRRAVEKEEMTPKQMASAIKSDIKQDVLNGDITCDGLNYDIKISEYPQFFGTITYHSLFNNNIDKFLVFNSNLTRCMCLDKVKLQKYKPNNGMFFAATDYEKLKQIADFVEEA